MSLWKNSFHNSHLQFLHCKVGTHSVPQPKHDLRKKEQKINIIEFLKSSVIINHTSISNILVLISLMIVFIVLMKVIVGVSATGDTIQHIEAII